MPNGVMTAVLFPGQGSQEKGMGRELADASADCKDIFILAEKASGKPLREIFWDGDEADMADTRVLQPALTAVNLCFWFSAKSYITPSFAAGHSLGEFAALCAAGVLTVQDALMLTALRGRLMAEAGESSGGDGAMAAILKADEAAVSEMVGIAAEKTGAPLRIANYNTPQQFVISGRRDAVEAASQLAKERKARAVPLAVSGAFHSPLMAPAAAELAKAMAKVRFAKPQVPVVFNATAAPEESAQAIQDIMTRQMTESVLWTQGMNYMYGKGVRRFVELGPKGVLTRMVAPNLPGKDDVTALSVNSLEAIRALQAS